MPQLRNLLRILCLAVSSSCLVAAQSNHITLPSTGTVIVVATAKGDPVPTAIHASEPKFNTQAGGNFARAMVYANQHRALELEGKTSAAQIQGNFQAIYIRIGSEDPEVVRNRVTLLALDQDKETRVIARFSNNVFGGQHKRNIVQVAVNKEDAEEGRFLKLIPQVPLKPGEYGIVFMPKDVNFVGDLIYDFTIPEPAK